MTRPVLRDATPADAAEVARVYVDSWNAGMVPPLRSRELTEPEVRRWERDLAAPTMRWLVATLDGDVVGFVGTGPAADPSEPGLGELDTIAVAPSHWRAGTGRLLMAAALDALLDALLNAGHHRAVLWTLADTPAVTRSTGRQAGSTRARHGRR